MKHCSSVALTLVLFVSNIALAQDGGETGSPDAGSPDEWALQVSMGADAGFLAIALRISDQPGSPDATIVLDQKYAILLRVGYGPVTVVEWGDLNIKPAPYWADLKAVATTELQRYFNPPPPTPAPTAAGKGPTKDVDLAVKGPIATVDLSSDSVDKLSSVTSVLYTLAPGGETGVAAMTASGMVALDQLGGGKGVKVVTILPMLGIAVVPSDPKAFFENVTTTCINPAKQLKLVQRVLKPLTAKSISQLPKVLPKNIPNPVPSVTLKTCWAKVGPVKTKVPCP